MNILTSGIRGQITRYLTENKYFDGKFPNIAQPHMLRSILKSIMSGSGSKLMDNSLANKSRAFYWH